MFRNSFPWHSVCQTTMKQLRFYANDTPSVLATLSHPRVDRQGAIIYGVTAMMANVEAIGHGIMTDEKTIDMMVALASDGVPRRQRFGHPGVSEAMTGKQVARAVNFRKQNGHLVHDSYMLQEARISPAFAKDPVEYILALAENNPTEFGESVVITCDCVWIMPDGEEVSIFGGGDDGEDSDFYDDEMPKPADAVNRLPMIRPLAFHYVDWVNEGAATHNGIFGKKEKFFRSGVNSWAEDLFSFVDEFRLTYNIPLSQVPLKTNQLLSAYMVQRSKGDLTMKNKKLTGQPAASELVEVPTEELAPEVSSNEVDAGLNDLAARVEALTLRLSSQEEKSEEPTQLSSLEQRVEMLESDFEQLVSDTQAKLDMLQTRFDTVYATQVKLLAALEALEANQMKLSGEPVVKEKVSPVRPLTLESHSLFQSPRPPAVASLSKPVSLEERSSKLSANASPLEQSIILQQERARYANLGSV